MVVKELLIHGFKSFAQPIKIPFDHAMTAVIGPNGCGKSNILDALKWVLGEKSVKSMRGEKMEDVIFSGTATKKPAAFAQVILVLDNTTRLFDIDLDEIRLGRRLYRDGQSHYLINDVRVPRRELESLLMDTGMGKSSYSFMEQGNMDLILSSKPEDRRTIFEEAAGISRYKAQKEEAIRNLENTQINIDRIKDVMRELKRELDLKTEQAQRTEAYNKLLSERKEYDLRIRFFTIKETDKKQEALATKLSRKQNDREKIQQKQFLNEEQIKELDKIKENLIEEMHKMDTTNQVSRERIHLLNKRVTEIREKQKGVQAQMEDVAKHIHRFDVRLRNLKSEQSRQKQLTIEIQGKLSATREQITAMEEKISLSQKRLERARKELAEVQGSILAKDEELKTLREEQAAVIRELLETLQKQKALLAEKEAQHQEQTEVLLRAFSEIDALVQSSQPLDPTVFKKIWKSANPSLSVRKIADYGLTLRKTIFDEGGIHSRKEKIDARIKQVESEQEAARKKSERLRLEITKLQEEIADLRSQKESVTGDLKSFQLQSENSSEKEEQLQKQIQAEESQLQFFRGQYRQYEETLLDQNEEIKSIDQEIATIEKDIKKDIEKIAALEKKIERTEEKKKSLFESLENDQKKLSALIDELNELEIQIGTILGMRESMVQEIYNDYNMNLKEVEEKLGRSRLQLAAEKEKLAEVQKEIQKLGVINPLAIEELNNVKELYEHNKLQLEDILEAKADIQKVLDEIEETSRKLFTETFQQIQTNFENIFSRLFNGGSVKLELADPDNPLSSGIDIQVQPPGKRARSLRLLSGGEKAMTAISLMFAIYLVKSSPFCVLDEIDAPLDDSNVSRFLQMLDEFKEKTQFVLITHHKKTMAHADAIFGVTMEEPGVSKVLSVELKPAS